MNRKAPFVVAIALIALFATVGTACAEPVPPYDKAECLQCHRAGGVASPTEDFDVPQVVNRLTTCAACHNDSRLTADTLSHQHMQTGCDDEGCHDSDYAFAFEIPGGVLTEDMRCWMPGYGYFHTPASPYLASSSLHYAHARQWVPVTFAPYNNVCATQCHLPSGCTTCHTGEIAHDTHGSPSGQPRDCTVTGCHELDDAGTSAFVPTCESCHARNLNEHGYDPSQHTADVTATVDGGGKTCGDCHLMELDAEHGRASASSRVAGCGACHPQPRESFSAWGQTCQQGGCHPAGTPTQPHGSIEASHAPLVADVDSCGDCHAGDLRALHADASTGTPPRTSCLVCHSAATVPASRACASVGCHEGITGDHEAQHDTAGLIDDGCYGCHYQYLTGEHAALGYSCSTCHESSNTVVLAAIDDNDRSCDACHPAVNGRDRHESQAAFEFVPENQSVHRVNDALPGARSLFRVGATDYAWTLPPAASFLKSGWSTESIMSCDDCHTYAGTASGPHGATVTVNIDPDYPASYESAMLGYPNDELICSKCHTDFGSMNTVHDGDHDGELCVQCHAKVPHGWRLPRLLAYTDDPPAYASYGLTGVTLGDHAPDTWSEAHCSASCGNHTASIVRWPSQPVALGSLVGTVLGDAGDPVAGATVIADGQSATTDALGNYTFAALSAGTHSVSVSKTGFTTQTQSATVVAGASVRLDFTLVPIRAGTLSGAVTDAGTAATLPGATVSVAGGGSTTTGGSGEYTLSLMPGTYTVTYAASGYGAEVRSVTIAGGTTTTVNVSLAPAPANLALGRPATSSSQFDTTDAPAQAVDGRVDTRWRSLGTRYEWLRVDLGSSTAVKRFVVRWADPFYAATFRIDTSTNGSTWTSRYWGSGGDGGVDSIVLSSAATARYVRLYCMTPYDVGYRVVEFEVYGD